MTDVRQSATSYYYDYLEFIKYHDDHLREIRLQMNISDETVIVARREWWTKMTHFKTNDFETLWAATEPLADGIDILI